MTWTLRARAADLSSGAIFSDWTGTLVERYNLPDTLQVDGTLAHLRSLLTPGGGCTLEDDNGLRFSGPLTEFTKRGDGTCTATFASDLIWLWGRICYATPGAVWASQTADFDTRTGAAETVILSFVNVNAGPGALTARRAGLTLPTSGERGGTITTTARFDNLGQLVHDLAEAAGLRITVLQDGTDLALAVAQPADLSAWARYGTADAGGPGILSEDWEYTARAPELTRAMVAGGGASYQWNVPNRVNRERTDTTAETLWALRHEVFVDQRGSSAASSAWKDYLDARADKNEKVNAYDAVSDKLAAAQRRKDAAQNAYDQAALTLTLNPGNSTATSNKAAAQDRLDDATDDVTDFTADKAAALTAKNAAVTAEADALDAYDAAVIADQAEYDKAGDDEIAQGAEPVQIRATLPDVLGMRLVTEVPVGSKVGLDLDGTFVVDRLRQVTTEFGVDGVVATGVVGSADAGLTRDQRQFLKIRKALRKVQAR